MRFSLTFPALAANMAAVLAAPQPQDLNINMIVAAPDPTYSEAVGVTAQVVTLDSTAIAAQATSAVSSVSIAVSDVLSGTDVAKRDIAKRTACAPQPTGASMYSAAPTDPSAWASYSVFSSAAAAAPTPAGYNNTFSNLAASNNAYEYLGFTTLQSYATNTGQYVGSDQYLIEYSYGYPVSGSHGLSPKPGDKQGAIYQAVKDMSYYPASLTSTFQPFCSSILGYSAGSTTVTTATVTPISYTTVTNVIYQRAASTNPTPAVLTKYPATVVSSACSSVVTSPTATPFVTSTATFSASAVVSTIVTSSTYVIPACSGPSEACAPFVGCGSGTYCECLQRMRGRSAACIDPNQSPGSSCNSDSDCAPGSICFSSCVGNTCQTFQDPNSGICINGNSAKYLFRRGPEARKAAIVPVVDNIKRGLDCNTGKFYCEEV
ncbi:hypothetical protein KCU77_g691, partial [Aureobasidium melanogenum]